MTEKIEQARALNDRKEITILLDNLYHFLLSSNISKRDHYLQMFFEYFTSFPIPPIKKLEEKTSLIEDLLQSIVPTFISDGKEIENDEMLQALTIPLRSNIEEFVSINIPAYYKDRVNRNTLCVVIYDNLYNIAEKPFIYDINQFRSQFLYRLHKKKDKMDPLRIWGVGNYTNKRLTNIAFGYVNTLTGVVAKSFMDYLRTDPDFILETTRITNFILDDIKQEIDDVNIQYNSELKKLQEETNKYLK